MFYIIRNLPTTATSLHCPRVAVVERINGDYKVTFWLFSVSNETTNTWLQISVVFLAWICLQFSWAGQVIFTICVYCPSSVLKRAKTAEVLRVPTADYSQSTDTREAKVKRNGVNFCCCCCLVWFWEARHLRHTYKPHHILCKRKCTIPSIHPAPLCSVGRLVLAFHVFLVRTLLRRKR